MIRRLLLASVACLALTADAMHAQTSRVIPRPPAQPPGPQNPEAGSAAPDGYAPIPEWLGQTRAPRPAKTAAYQVETVAAGLMGAFCFSFLPDGRIIVGERAGRIRIVGKDGRAVGPDRGTAVRPVGARPARVCSRSGRTGPSRSNRMIYLTYTALPDGTDASSPPRCPAS